MKQSILIPALFFLLHTTLSAQWQLASAPPPGPGVDDFTGIAFPSPQVGFVASYNGRIFKTTDGGQTWNKVFEAPPVALIVLEGINFFNSSVGCAYGLNLDGSFGIVSTTDGGQTWRQFGHTVPFSLGRCRDAAWGSATTAYVCGEFGLVLKTTDGGVNWAPVTPPPVGDGIIADIDFPTTNIGYVLAQGGSMARTDNGGITWTYLGNWGFNAIQFFDGSNGLASGISGFYKTQDGGSSWQLIAPDVPLPGFQFAADRLSGFGVSVDHNILRSTDGGQTWYTQGFNVPASYILESLYTVSPETGWISGYFLGQYPFLATTTNGGGLGARIIKHTDTLTCLGSVLQAEAAVIGGTPTLAEWLLDGQIIGTGLVLEWISGSLSPGSHDLVFRVSDGNGEIRLSRKVIVPSAPEYSASSFFPGSPALCIGQKTVIYTPLTNTLDTFALFINGSLWQGPKTVHAGQEPFAFTTPGIADTLNCEVVVKYACGWSPVSSFQILPKPLPIDTFQLTTDKTLLCSTNNVVHLKVSGSESNTMYFLYENGQYLFPPAQAGWSGPLLFTSTSFDSTRVFKVKAINLATQCEIFMRDSIAVQVEHPSASFYVEEGVNLLNGTPVHITFTGQEANVFHWDFGPHALPAISNQPDPGTIVFEDNSVSTIRLVTTAPLGCRDTFEHSLGMYQHGALPEDWAIQIPFPSQFFYPHWQAVVVDGQKNIYTHGQAFSQGVAQNDQYWPSKWGVSGLPLKKNLISLAKYDPYGVYQWSVEWGGFDAVTPNYIAADISGNLFAAVNVPYGVTPGDPFGFGSTTGKRYKPSRKYYHIALLKYDTKGRFQWMVGIGRPGNSLFFEFITDLKTDAAGNVYLFGSQGQGVNSIIFESVGEAPQEHTVTKDFLAKYNAEGKLLWVADLSSGGELEWGGQGSLTIDQQGNIVLCGFNTNQTGDKKVMLAKLDSQGNLLWKLAPVANGLPSSWAPENIVCDSAGNIYMTGAWAYGLSIGPFSFFDSTFLGKHQFFIAGFNPEGVPLWMRSGFSTDNARGNDLALYNGQVYVRGNFTGDMDFNGLHVEGLGSHDAFLFRLSAADGHLTEYSYFNTVDPLNPFALYDCSGESIEITPDGRVHLIGGNGYEVNFGPEKLTGPDTRYLMKGSPAFFLSGTSQAGVESGISCNIHPNPSTASALLELRLETREELDISIYDVAGRFENALVNQIFSTGIHILRLDDQLDKMASGLHWVVIKKGDGSSKVLKWMVQR